MRTLRITLAYDGADFHGWQIQPGLRTAQGELEDAFARIVGERVRITGSSRTDAGVHALAQTASLSTECALPCPRLRAALDALTGDDLVPIEVVEAPAGFDARRWADGKTYEYRIRNAPTASPFERRYSWHLRDPLRLDAMRAAARSLAGEHDFSSFRAAGCDARSPIRVMRRLEVHREADTVRIVMEASGFLQGMARIISGTLVDVGRGRMDPDRVRGILDARDRRLAGRTAPPHGLFLVAVHYGETRPTCRDPEPPRTERT